MGVTKKRLLFTAVTMFYSYNNCYSVHLSSDCKCESDKRNRILIDLLSGALHVDVHLVSDFCDNNGVQKREIVAA